jgi:hypothetical protein
MLPTKNITHTLNNIEPQNIQMAQDLLVKNEQSTTATANNMNDNNNILKNPRFCVVLRAMDTGRIASISTILEIVNATEQYEYGTLKISRIQLTCRAQQLVKIVKVVNGQGWTEKRVLRSNEYLRAKVRPITTADDESSSSTDENIETTTTTTTTTDSYEEKLASLIKIFKQLKQCTN